jgi:polyhydroxyalkanoate synthase
MLNPFLPLTSSSAEPPSPLAPTPRDVVLTDGPARLMRFRRPPGVKAAGAAPVLLVPSMINRWYVLDLRAGCSVAEACANAGLDTWCLDWGAPQDEDRHFTWADCVARLDRMMRRVSRETGAKQLTVLGYCMGATLASIHAALEPKRYAGFINLLGPIDFSEGGMLARMTRPEWFDAEAVANAGNVAPQQMQSGFQMLRPTASLGKWVTWAERAADPSFRDAFDALETWASDNVAFPAAAYVTYIQDLYQQNLLLKGEHAGGGRRVSLKNIVCPLLTVVASKDTICPPKAATALNQAVGSAAPELLEVPGGHVGAVVGSKAAISLYPRLVSFMKERTWN